MPIFRSLHLFGVLIFVGNIVVTALWKTMADRTKNPKIIAYAQRLVTLTDVIFTAPGAALTAAGGYALAISQRRELLGEHWIMGGQFLFILTGVIWLVILVPIQMKQAKITREHENADELPDTYWRLAMRWSIAGSICTILPLITFFLMIHK